MRVHGLIISLAMAGLALPAAADDETKTFAHIELSGSYPEGAGAPGLGNSEKAKVRMPNSVSLRSTILLSTETVVMSL